MVKFASAGASRAQLSIRNPVSMLGNAATRRDRTGKEEGYGSPSFAQNASPWSPSVPGRRVKFPPAVIFVNGKKPSGDDASGTHDM